MTKFVYLTQFLIIGIYAFNTLAYVYLKQYNKAFYWFGATCLCIGVLRMK